MRRFVAFGAVLALMNCAGCALLQHASSPALPLLSPQSLGAQRVASQVLHVAYGAQELSLQCALRAGADADQLIAIGPVGQRLFTLHYDADGVHVKTRPHAPKMLRPRRVWADVQLALWPLAAWQQRVQGTAWSVTQPRPGVRRLRHGSQLISEVHYAAGSNGWNGRLWLVDFVYDYSLDISSRLQADD